MDDKKQCSKCQAPLDKNQFHKKSLGRHQSKCPQCRSDEYYSRKYKENCKECNKPGRLDLDKICYKCNKRKGLKQCLTCLLTLSQAFSFYTRQSVCKKCHAKYKRDSRCRECGYFYKLYKNGLCLTCNKDLGLRQCKICKELLFISVYFKDKHAVCNNCKGKPIQLGF